MSSVQQKDEMQNSHDVHQLLTEWGCSLWLWPELWIKPINPFSVAARASHWTTTNVSSQKLQILCSFIILRYYYKKKLWKNDLSKKLTSSFTHWWSKGDRLSSCDWLGELAGDLKTCETCWWSCSICGWTSCFLLLPAVAPGVLLGPADNLKTLCQLNLLSSFSSYF